MCDRCEDSRCSDPDSKGCSDILLMRYAAERTRARQEVTDLLAAADADSMIITNLTRTLAEALGQLRAALTCFCDASVPDDEVVPRRACFDCAIRHDCLNVANRYRDAAQPAAGG